MKRIGFPNLTYLPFNNRIRTLYDEYMKLFSNQFRISIVPLLDASMSKEIRDNLMRKFIEGIDIFFGYDRQFMQMRKMLDYKPKLILPMYADMTRGGITLWINQKNFFQGDTLMFSSYADKQIYLNSVEAPELYTKVIPLPIGEIFEGHLPKPLKEWHQELRLLYVGRLVREKNIHILLKVCSKLKKNYNFKLVLVGSWSFSEDGKIYRDEIIKMVSEFGLEKNVVFKGFIQGVELLEVYRTADVFINLTTNSDENFGLAVIEAMSQGLPIICTDWGGLKDHIIDEWNGYKIQTRVKNDEILMDIGDIVQCVYRLDNRKTRSMMSQHAKQYYLAKYQRKTICQQIVQIMSHKYQPNLINIYFKNETRDYCMRYIFENIINKNSKCNIFAQDIYSSYYDGGC